MRCKGSSGSWLNLIIRARTRNPSDCRVTTYAALSAFLGSLARAVGSGMQNNPFALGVPCHRVLASDGDIGGFGGRGGRLGRRLGRIG